MNYARLPGPGDEATWGPCTGHPNDPRTEADEDGWQECSCHGWDDDCADCKGNGGFSGETAMTRAAHDAQLASDLEG